MILPVASSPQTFSEGVIWRLPLDVDRSNTLCPSADKLNAIVVCNSSMSALLINWAGKERGVENKNGFKLDYLRFKQLNLLFKSFLESISFLKAM